jgi:hypothetical protein
MVMIRNTAELETILVSEAMSGSAPLPEGVEIIGEPEEIRFDEEGNIAE